MPSKKKASDVIKAKYVIVGACTTGTSAAQTLRQVDPESKIILLGQEQQLPYHRPPLSKLASRRDSDELIFTPILPAQKYEQLGIDLMLGTSASDLDTKTHRLKALREGQLLEIQYQKLLIATGVRATQLPVAQATLKGIHYLRTYDDASGLLKATESARNAVIIGGSFIGMEIASLLRHKGLQVTLIERKSQLLSKLHHPDISRHFEKMMQAHGVTCHLGCEPLGFEGTDHVTAVVTNDGKTIGCDLVVIGTGVTPNTEWLQGSGIELDDGVKVNEFLQTSDPDVYAAGDVANAWHPVFRKYLRTEHFDNAIKQGRAAARNMAGGHEPFTHISYFFSHVFEENYNVLGLTRAESHKISRGDVDNPPYEVLYLKKDICEGFFALGRTNANTRAAEILIRDRVNLKPHARKIKDIGFALSCIPGQVLFVLQGGGSYGAFECGAVRALLEHKIFPNAVAGVSIGAFNAAIIASAREHAAEALDSFWNEVSTYSAPLGDEATRRMLASNHIGLFGVPGFFTPRWIQAMLWQGEPPNKWTSFYDFTEAKDLIKKYVDFDSLSESPVRLLITAVDIQTSEVVLFDSYVDRITPDHILASGSLPPAFSWTTIDGRHYWDAGIISNSPLDVVMDRLEEVGKQIYLIDLFTGRNEHLPANMIDVYSRREEIIFSERLRQNRRTEDSLLRHRRLIELLMAELPQDVADRYRSEPLYQQLMGQTAANVITRISRETTPQDPPSRAYDFSRSTVLQLIEDGYQTANTILKKKKH